MEPVRAFSPFHFAFGWGIRFLASSLVAITLAMMAFPILVNTIRTLEDIDASPWENGHFYTVTHLGGTETYHFTGAFFGFGFWLATVVSFVVLFIHWYLGKKRRETGFDLPNSVFGTIMLYFAIDIALAALGVLSGIARAIFFDTDSFLISLSGIGFIFFAFMFQPVALYLMNDIERTSTRELSGQAPEVPDAASSVASELEPPQGSA